MKYVIFLTKNFLHFEKPIKNWILLIRFMSDKNNESILMSPEVFFENYIFGFLMFDTKKFSPHPKPKAKTFSLFLLFYTSVLLISSRWISNTQSLTQILARNNI